MNVIFETDLDSLCKEIVYKKLTSGNCNRYNYATKRHMFDTFAIDEIRKSRIFSQP